MEPEIVMNLWVFIQSLGPLNIIYELGVRPYVMIGSDDEKTRLLQDLSVSDFHFARRFPLPTDRYYLKVTERDGVIISASSGDTMEEGKDVRKGLALVRPDISGMHQMEYFNEALAAIEKSLPTRRLGIDGPETEVPKVNRRNLLSVITNVNIDGQGNQIAQVDASRRSQPPSAVTNLWMFHDDKANAIYAVAGRPYMVHGLDSEKTRILKALAPHDFSMVSALPVPAEFSTTVAGKTRKGVLAVSSDGRYNKALFNDVLRAFEREIPATIGIDGKLTNRMSISSAQMMSAATRITERSSNVGETASIQLIESPRPTPATVQTPEVRSQTPAKGITVETTRADANPTVSASSAPVVSISQRSARGNAKGAIENIGAGLEILRTMTELSPNVPKDEAAFFGGTMTAVLNLVYWHSVGDEEVRQQAWWTLTRAQSYCAKYVKTNWKQEEKFRALEVERPHLIAGRSPDSNVFNSAATEILIAVLACLHTTFKMGSIGRSSYESAIPCIQWLTEYPDPLVSGQARDILVKVKAAPEKKGGCFVATAAYGPQDCNVLLLQEYRDQIMIRSFLGRRAVRIYYFRVCSIICG